MNNDHVRADRGYDKGFTKLESRPSLQGTETAASQSVFDKAFEAVVQRGKQIEWLRESRLVQSVYKRLHPDDIPIPYRTAPEMVDIVQNAIKDDLPALVWGHWMDPHTPYHPDTAVDLPDDLPDIATLDELNENIIIGEREYLSDEDIELAKELYAANIRYFDQHFSELLSWFQNQPWYDQSLIVFVSDHGEYFGEHDLFFHEWKHVPHDVTIDTPLWVKYPGQESAGETFDHLVGHGDILATIKAVTGSPVSVPSHTAPLREMEGRHVVSISNLAKRLTEPNGKYVIERDGTTEEEENVSEAGREFIEGVEFPTVKSSDGKARGVKEAERQRRLHHLGYRD